MTYSFSFKKLKYLSACYEHSLSPVLVSQKQCKDLSPSMQRAGRVGLNYLAAFISKPCCTEERCLYEGERTWWGWFVGRCLHHGATTALGHTPERGLMQKSQSQR